MTLHYTKPLCNCVGVDNSRTPWCGSARGGMGGGGASSPVMKRPRRRSRPVMKCPWAWLVDELKLEVAASVESPLDRAALSLAIPTLGIIARNNLQSYRGILMRLAFHVTLGNPVDKALLRRYASQREATWAGCDWLNSVTLAKGLATGYHQVQDPASGEYKWHLLDGDGREGALLLCRLSSGTVLHYEGDIGAERMVRAEHPDGPVQHFEGERGAERMVRVQYPDGRVVP